jgi:hypothetical protein
MNIKLLRCSAAVSLLACAVVLPVFSQTPSGQPKITRRDTSPKRPLGYLATYADANDARLIAPGRISANNGETWRTFAPTPDFNAGLPYGYRRNAALTMYDPRSKRLLTALNALDTPDLDPKTPEPAIAARQYYIRYRVSRDGGRTWLFDEPVVQSGGQNGQFTAEHPIPDVQRGRNGLYLGDSGSVPISTQSGHIVLAAQMTVVGPDGKLMNPFKQPSYTRVVVLVGTWQPDSRVQWEASRSLGVSPQRSTRGVIEPTLAQFPDGRLLMVMRGSNAGKPGLPGYRWYSISSDDGRTWSDPKAWTYVGGRRFFSPSSMSLLVRHSSGRVFWIGNITEKNPNGNDPRWPVVLGEVDPATLMLKRRTVIELDTKRSEDDARGRELVEKFNGRLDFSHFWAFEDRRTHEIVVIYPRQFAAQKSDWVTLRVDVS